jgi:hypothetical protein
MQTNNPPENWRIEHPCPMRLSRMKKQDERFFCGSCQRKVLDLRKKSIPEIQALVQAGEVHCGIFTEDQIPGQRKKSWGYQAVWLVLSGLSFLGVPVAPLSGAPRLPQDTLPQPAPSAIHPTEVTEAPATGEASDRKWREEWDRSRPKKKWWRFRRNRARRHYAGCPSF